MRPLSFPDLPSWSFRVEEISAGVYRVFGKNIDGRTVESDGTDVDEVIRSCVDMARRQSPGEEGHAFRMTLEDLLTAHQALNECCNGEPMEVTGLSRPCLDSMAKTLDVTSRLCRAHLAGLDQNADRSAVTVAAPLSPQDISNCVLAMETALRVIEDWEFGIRLGSEKHEVQAALSHFRALTMPDAST
jgi:hypothetical protein